MDIPKRQSIKLPALQHIADGREYHYRDIVVALANHFSLTDQERGALGQSGQRKRFDSTCSFALIDLKEAVLVERTKSRFWKITTRGLEVLEALNQEPEKIKAAFLQSQPQLLSYLNDRWPVTSPPVGPIDRVDSIEKIYQQISEELAVELLQKIKDNSPTFFEELVVDLLVKMGYGGTREDAGSAVGGSGDGGIDGIINEDRLGLDVVYIQAKRWESTVGRPEIQKFAGALQGQRARKGIFITTSDFSKEAREYVQSIDSKIILIDGDQLAQFMIDYNVGVSTVNSYEIKQVDSDYFADD